MTNKINYTKNGNVVKIDCGDDYGWGERLCECVLDGALWAKVVDCGTYMIEDADEMETLVAFIRAFNVADLDNEDLNNAINDWSILI